MLTLNNFTNGLSDRFFMSSVIRSIVASGRRVLLVVLVVLIAGGCKENPNNTPNAEDRSPRDNHNDGPNVPGRSPTDRPINLDVTLQDVLVLGADESASPEYLFGWPGYVATDSEGHIYVADMGIMAVRVYDAEGHYLRTIGARGQGPGEMLSIKAMYVNDRDQLLLYDRNNERVTRFAPDGTVLTQHSAPNSMNSMKVQMYSLEMYHLLLYSKIPKELSNKRLFHLFSPDFQEVVASFVDVGEVWQSDNLLDEILLSLDPGRFVVAESEVVYVPGLYRGMVHRYKKEQGQWRPSGVQHGYVETTTPYKEIATESPYADHRISTADNKNFAVLSYNQSRGLFRLQDGRLVHFTFCKFGDERVFGVEVFDKLGNLIGYGPIRSVPWDTSKPSLVNWDVVWKDDQDRFYIIDKDYIPFVRVVEIRFQSASS